MRNAELYLEEAKVMFTFGFHQLAARLPDLAPKSAPAYSTKSKGASFQLITRRVSDDTKLSKFTLLR